MKYLGVDYGKKNIGLAISDSEGRVAMPFGVFQNKQTFKDKFKKVIAENSIDQVVLGESKDLKGRKNLIQEEIDLFRDFIEELGIKVNLVNELMTSMESKWGIEKRIRREKKTGRKKNKQQRIDDKAATMILKTFLEKQNNL